MSEIPSRDECRRLLFAVDWEGPYERLEGLFLGVRRDGTLRWEVRDDPPSLLARLADWADHKNIVWRNRHCELSEYGEMPWRIWKRRKA